MSPAQCAMLQRVHPALLGRAIRFHRQAVGLTQRDLGSHARVTGAYLSRLESGDRTPSPEVLERFAEALETTVDVMLGLAVDPDHPDDAIDCLICGSLVRPEVLSIHQGWHATTGTGLPPVALFDAIA